MKNRSSSLPCHQSNSFSLSIFSSCYQKNLNFTFALAIFISDVVFGRFLRVLSFYICANSLWSYSLWHLLNPRGRLGISYAGCFWLPSNPLSDVLHCCLVIQPQLHLGYLSNTPDIRACFRFHHISASTSNLRLENRLLIHQCDQNLCLRTNHDISQKCPGLSFRSHHFLIEPIFSQHLYLIRCLDQKFENLQVTKRNLSDFYFTMD